MIFQCLTHYTTNSWKLDHFLTFTQGEVGRVVYSVLYA